MQGILTIEFVEEEADRGLVVRAEDDVLKPDVPRVIQSQRHRVKGSDYQCQLARVCLAAVVRSLRMLIVRGGKAAMNESRARIVPEAGTAVESEIHEFLLGMHPPLFVGGAQIVVHPITQQPVRSRRMRQPRR